MTDYYIVRRIGCIGRRGGSEGPPHTSLLRPPPPIPIPSPPLPHPHPHPPQHHCIPFNCITCSQHFNLSCASGSFTASVRTGAAGLLITVTHSLLTPHPPSPLLSANCSQFRFRLQIVRVVRAIGAVFEGLEVGSDGVLPSARKEPLVCARPNQCSGANLAGDEPQQ